MDNLKKEESPHMSRLIALVDALKDKSAEERCAIIDQDLVVRAFFNKRKDLDSHCMRLNPFQSYLLKVIVAIGEGPVVYGTGHISWTEVEFLLSILQPIEHFYRSIGGVAGYHLLVLNLIDQQKAKTPIANSRYLQPVPFDIRSDSKKVRQAVLWGLENLPFCGAIFPVGGAGDRLNLKDLASGEPLPAALLPFCGANLLELLIRELQSLEALYFKLFKKEICIPIALMTSYEKNNHTHILQILEGQEWFGRGRDHFFLMVQPQVPVITEEGHWLMKRKCVPTLKPGGHGALWKVGQDAGLFDWFESKGCSKALIRQINNPLGGIDLGALPLIGLGCHEKKAFGFASCQRQVASQEGMNVIVEKEGVDGQLSYCLTNVEYTEFLKQGIEQEGKDSYSLYPCNTNILFADLKAIAKVVDASPLPGVLVNLKNSATYTDSLGHHREVKVARLESTMQNIADELTANPLQPIETFKWNSLPTFITFAERAKTISVTKRTFDSKIKKNPEKDTPEKAFYDLQLVYHQLLESCAFDMPTPPSFEQFATQLPFLIHLHPSLGPLHAIIAQKLQKGRLLPRSELHLNIAELEIKGLHLSGSLLIQATHLFDYARCNQDSSAKLQANKFQAKKLAEGGRCELFNVKVVNQGMSLVQKEPLWQHQIERQEQLMITLFGSGEFFAEGLEFKGNQEIQVEDGWKVSMFKAGGQLKIVKEKLKKPSWSWSYSLTESLAIALKK